MSNTDIVVTGVGLLAAVGTNADTAWDAIRAGRSGIVPVTTVDASSFISRYAGEVPLGTDILAASARSARPTDRCHTIALAAAREAVTHARLSDSPYVAHRVAISVGTSLGGARSGDRFHRQWMRDGLRRADATVLREYPLHSVPDHLAARLGYTGARTVHSNACAAGAVAIAYGVELLLSGQADAVIAGGVDPLAFFSFGGFSCLGALDPEPCAPYTRSTGLNLGEGAGILILERRDAAASRGVTPLAAVRGYGLSADAHHATAPDPTGRGALRAMHAALAMAGMTVDDIDYVNGHGTGTPANDSVETRAIAHLRESAPPAISSTKSMVGHTLGAAGAVEAVTTVLALRDGVLPPTVLPGDGTVAPHDLDIVPGTGRAAEAKAALSNSFAFGGNNASLLLARADVPSVRRDIAPGRRSVVTGVAVIAGDAPDTQAVRTAMASSTPLYGELSVDLDHYGSFPVADIPERNSARGINPQMLRRLDGLGRRSAVAVADLLKQHRLTREESSATGLVFATGTGPLSTVEAFQRELIESGTGNTRLFPNTVMNAAPGHVALLNKLQGPTATFCAGGTSAVSALHFAVRLIDRGAADRVIVLAADEAPAAMLAGYARIPGFLSRDRCVPFANSGKVYGGAAVALMLEAADLTSPDRVMASIDGFGLAGDASGPGRLDPSGEGWTRSFQNALRDAALSAGDIDLVVSAACGREAIDEVETRARIASGLDAAGMVAPKALTGDAGSASALLGIAQAIWMREETARIGAWGTVQEQANGRRRSARTLVSSFEVGGSYQSVIVSTPNP